MTPEAAAKMGLLPGIPVFVGALDVVAASLGVGAYDAGNISVVLGTTCASLIVHDKEGCDPTRYWRHFLPHVCVDKAVEVMSTLNGMTNIDWALKELLGRPDYALADQMAAVCGEQTLAGEEGAAVALTHEGIVIPRIPQALHHVQVLIGNLVAQRMLRVFFAGEVPG